MSERTALAWIGIATLLGAALRIAGLATDFWLDEVWTWAIARRLDGPLEVFTGIHHSNNHHLVTLWVLALGDAAPAWAYRLPSVLAGIASIPLAAALAWPRGRLEAAVAATGVAGCFALVHFSSEARGYALAVALALAAHLALRRELACDSRSGAGAHAALLFGICSSLGLLAHLGFVFYWAGAAALSLRQARGLPAGEALRRLLRLHGLPVATLALLAATDLWQMRVGSGDPTDLARLAARTLGFAFGLPTARALALPGLAAFLAALAAALVLRARREGAEGWIAELVTIVIAPLLVFALTRPDVIAVRYFLIGIAFSLILFAELFAAGWRAGGLRRALAGAVALGFLAGSVAHDAAFLAHGRGGYRAAVDAMLAHGGPVVTVASDHDFRNRIVLAFHTRHLAPPRRLVYVRHGQHVEGGPEWRILHRGLQGGPLPPILTDAEGHRYRLFATYDHAAISGFTWALYRNERSSTTVPKP